MQPTPKKIIHKTNRGFTLVELMVAVSVFIIIMTISMGSILSVFDANKKSQTIRTVLDNLNFTMESMTRTIRFGTNYHCGSSGDITSPLDCPNNGVGENIITVKASSGSQVTYKLVDGRIVRAICPSVGACGLDYFLTSSDVIITNMTFRVWGSAPYSSGGDIYQPQVIIVIGGYSGTKQTSQSSFSLETTVSQRLFDSQ